MMMADTPSSSTEGRRRVRDAMDMKGAQFVIHSNLRVFSKAIASLSRVAEDIYLEISADGMVLEAFDRAQSACGVYRFSTAFFHSVDTTLLNPNNENICRLSMKSALQIFKGVKFDDRNYISVQFNIDPKADCMVIHLLMNYDISRTIKLKMMECYSPPHRPRVNKEAMRNITVVAAEFLLPVLHQLHSDCELLTLIITQDAFILKNYQSRAKNFSDLTITDRARKAIKSETSFNIEKLEQHNVERPTELSFSLREFMAIVNFGNQQGSEITLYYDEPSKQMVIVSIETHPSFTSDFYIATIDLDDEGDVEGGVFEANNEENQRVEGDLIYRRGPRRGPPKTNAEAANNRTREIFSQSNSQTSQQQIPPDNVERRRSEVAEERQSQGEVREATQPVTQRQSQQNSQNDRNNDAQPIGTQVQNEVPVEMDAGICEPTLAAPEQVDPEGTVPIDSQRQQTVAEDYAREQENSYVEPMEAQNVAQEDFEEEDLPLTPPPRESPRESSEIANQQNPEYENIDSQHIKRTKRHSMEAQGNVPKRNVKLRRLLMGMTDREQPIPETQRMSQFLGNEPTIAEDSDWEEK